MRVVRFFVRYGVASRPRRWYNQESFCYVKDGERMDGSGGSRSMDKAFRACQTDGPTAPPVF